MFINTDLIAIGHSCHGGLEFVM